MKKRIIVFCLLICIIHFNLLLLQGAPLLLDDFNDGDNNNLLGGSYNTFVEGTGSCSYELNNNESIIYGRSGYSLKIDYNSGSVKSGWYETFATNLSLYNLVSFRIKGAIGGEKFKVGIRSGGVESKVYVSDFLESGITTSWQKIVIPFIAFQGISDWTTGTVFSITFTNNIGPASGTIYLDDIIFLSNPTTPIVLDNFDDGADPNLYGGSTGDWIDPLGSSISASYTSNSSERYKGYSYKLVLTDSATTSNCQRWFNLGSATNLSECDTLTFQLKSQNSGVTLVAGFWSGSSNYVVKINDYATVTTQYTYVEIPFAAFSGLPSADLVSWTFWFDNKDLGVFQTTDQTVYLDNIIFKDNTGPTTPDNLKANGASVGDGFLFNILNNLEVTVPSGDITLEGVRFEYSLDGVLWYIIGTDYDVSDSTFKITWNTTGLDTTKAYYIRAVSFDVSGNESAMTSFQNCSIINELLVDDFDDGSDPNFLGGNNLNSWNGATGSYDSSLFYGDSGVSFKIYSPAADNGAGVYFNLNNVDINDYDVISFWVKGLNGGEEFLVGLKDINNYETKRWVNRVAYLYNGEISKDEWRKVRIPLIDFWGVDLSNIVLVSFTFYDNSTIYIDDLLFTTVGGYVMGVQLSLSGGREFVRNNDTIYVNGSLEANRVIDSSIIKDQTGKILTEGITKSLSLTADGTLSGTVTVNNIRKNYPVSQAIKLVLFLKDTAGNDMGSESSNFLNIESTVLENKIWIGNNLFNPDKNEIARIYFTVDSIPQNIKIDIYDATGNPIRNLKADTVQDYFNFVDWDGKDSNGKIVSSGVYIVNIIFEKFNKTERILLIK